ncbi:lamin tail domain-containing protein [Gracilimonas halophila]|uniref:Lamin tail domain-containing protein n=1 Tax=Gracilimonas halophila TaxID=1834464 RepID=A0ABW5JNV3_9BACT
MKTYRTFLLSLLMLFGFVGSAMGQVTSDDAWINEFHYDNDGSDVGEFVEIVVKDVGSYTLSDFIVHLYNGSNGESYGSQTLDFFTEGETVGDYTFFYWEPSSIQNGPDAVSLTHNVSVVQFLSYGGTFIGSGGPADGVKSVDVGISETGSTPIGESLQLTGAGYGYDDFTWSGPSEDSPGLVNSSQSLTPAVEFSSAGATVNEADGTIDITVKIVIPDGNAVDVDVVFQQGPSTAQATDFTTSTTQTVSFGSGAVNGATQTATFTLNSDSDYEGIEEAKFILTNISTSGSATISGQTEYTLTIEDDDTPTVVINEFLADPGGIDIDGSGTYQFDDDEFIELYNNESVSVNISNWTLSDGAIRHAFPEGTVLKAKSAIVVFGSPDQYSGLFGGSIVQGTTSLGLANGGDTIILADNESNTVDSHTYTSGIPSGKSMVRDPEGTGTFKDHDAVTGHVGDYSPGLKTNGDQFNSNLLIEGNAGWRMLSAPVANMPISDITDDTPIQGFGDGFAKNFYTGYDGTSFTAPGDLTGNLNSGEGFILYFYNNNEASSSTLPVVIDISAGSEPSGDVTISSLNDDLHSDGWNLLGNPFQTAFNIDSITTSGGTTGLASAVAHIWSDEDESYILSTANDNKVAPGQGFFLQNDDATSVTLPITGKATGTRFYKTNKKESAFVQLELRTRDVYQNREQKDISTVLYFSDKAGPGWDKWDAKKLYPLKSSYSLLNIISSSDEQARTQDSRPFENVGEEIFYLEVESMNVKSAQVLEWNKSSNIPESWTFTFRDNKTGEEVLMDENFSYDFTHNEIAVNQKANKEANLKEVMTVKKKSLDPRFMITLSKGTSVTNEQTDQPQKMALKQNYPNPFNPTTSIYYSIPEAGEVNLTIYNVMGQRVHTLVDGQKSAGEYRVTWNATNMASGIYYYRFNYAGQVITRQMTLIK